MENFFFFLGKGGTISSLSSCRWGSSFCEKDVYKRQQYEGQDLGDVDFADRELRGVRFVNCRFYGAAMSGLFTRDCAFLKDVYKRQDRAKGLWNI